MAPVSLTVMFLVKLWISGGTKKVKAKILRNKVEEHCLHSIKARVAIKSEIIFNKSLRRNPPEVRVTSGQNFVPRLFTLYCKLLCDCFKYLLKRNHFKQHHMSKTNFEDHMKHLKVLVK